MPLSATKRTRRHRLLAAALAVPLAALAAASAQAATVPVAHSVRASASVDPSQLLLGAPITSEGATISIGGQTYSTGALEGRITIALSGDPITGISWQADFTMASPVDPGRAGDFGQVRIATVKLAPPGGQLSLPTSIPGTLTAHLSFQLERLPSGDAGSAGDAVTLNTDVTRPVILKAANVGSFPPLDQRFTLQEPVQLRPSSASESAGMVGTLDGFDVIVNQSSVPA